MANGEGPVHEVTLDPYWMDATAVTNARFAGFVEGTGYISEAERYGWSFGFSGTLSPALLDNWHPVEAPW